MADYSIWVLGESNISITGGVTLDGITQGNGSHLVGKYITINSTTSTEVFISDAGTETNFADSDSGQTLDGAQTIDGVSYASGTQIEAEYQLYLQDDNTGIVYRVVAVNVVNSSPAYATNEGLAFVGTPPPVGVSLRVIKATEGPAKKGTKALDASEFVPICFCAGTDIHTEWGQRTVETLRPGDQILRSDGSWVELKRVFHTKLPQTALQKNPKLRPVRIVAGALGNGLPKRDLRVSRQHRMLVSSKISERMFGKREVLIPAIKLTALPGIFIDDRIQEVEYFHLLFNEHEVIFAEGAPSESLFKGPEALKSIGPESRNELLSLFPKIGFAEYGLEPARFIPPEKLQKKLIQRHLANAKPLLR